MGINHIIFEYNFIPIGSDLDKIMGLANWKLKFARLYNKMNGDVIVYD